jgi:hypothetical protein
MEYPLLVHKSRKKEERHGSPRSLVDALKSILQVHAILRQCRCCNPLPLLVLALYRHLNENKNPFFTLVAKMAPDATVNRTHHPQTRRILVSRLLPKKTSPTPKWLLVRRGLEGEGGGGCDGWAAMGRKNTPARPVPRVVAATHPLLPCLNRQPILVSWSAQNRKTL